VSARLGALLALGGAVGCGAEATVPEQPTWVDHVKPILQANCFHCHGAAADNIRQAQPGLLVYRWDVFNLKDPRYAMMGFKEVIDPALANTKTFVSANDPGHYRFIDNYSNVQADEETRMPPRPALRLTTRELAVLERWSQSGFTLGARPENARPAIAWLQPGQTFAVTDGDGDQVLGKLDCGGTEVRMSSSGSHSLPPGTAPPCSGMLFDGFDLVSVDLK
jgi:hypothetical protein